MNVKRKLGDLGKIMEAPQGSEEIAPSLMLRDLKNPIEGLEAGQDFEGHIKGRCRGHEVRGGDGKKGGATHHYDLDVHDFEHKGKGAVKQKKSSSEEVGEAMDKYDKDKAKEKEEAKGKEQAKPK